MLRATVCAVLIGHAAFAQGVDATPDPAAPGTLSLNAEIVLSPEFCKVKKRLSGMFMDVSKAGKAACEQLYPALARVFSDLQRLEKVPSPGSSNAQITLIPRFVEISATHPPMRPSSQRKLVILLEWTIQDSMGRKVWLQTVQGTAQRRAGWVLTTKRVAALVDAAIAEMVKESVAKISAAPELRKLSQ